MWAIFSVFGIDVFAEIYDFDINSILYDFHPVVALLDKMSDLGLFVLVFLCFQIVGVALFCICKFVVPMVTTSEVEKDSFVDAFVELVCAFKVFKALRFLY